VAGYIATSVAEPPCLAGVRGPHRRETFANRRPIGAGATVAARLGAMKRHLVVLSLVVVGAGVTPGCKKESKAGLPPAKDWSGATAATGKVDLSAPPPTMPTAGGAMGGGGGAMGGGAMGGGGADPHAGLDMGGGEGGGGTDVAKLGLPPPDPSRAIDPTHVIVGAIKVDPKVRDRIKAGGAIYLLARRADAAGAPTGGPLAVERLQWGDQDALPFQLSEANAMTAGTQLTGDVVVMARFDQDGDALSKQPGDVTGQARVTVPSQDLTLTLDSVLP
jgi:hypothetical protein